MTNTTTLVRRWGLRALMVLAGCAFDAPAQAGWQSPFELTCFRRHRAAYYYAPPVVASYAPPVVASYAPPVTTYYAPAPCPQYVAKTYYQPVTSYQAQTYSEPQTSYRTSYYYEPVTSYRYSFAYDPCNCSYHQIATPQVSYQLRSQTAPETTYVQKTQLVPVTQYRQMTYFEPVAPACPCPQAPAPVVGPLTPAPAAGFTPPATTMPPAGVQESRSPSAGVNEFRGGSSGQDSPLNRPNSNPRSNIAPVNPAYTAPRQSAVTPRPDRITNNESGWKPVHATLAKRAIPD